MKMTEKRRTTVEEQTKTQNTVVIIESCSTHSLSTSRVAVVVAALRYVSHSERPLRMTFFAWWLERNIKGHSVTKRHLMEKHHPITKRTISPAKRRRGELPVSVVFLDCDDCLYQNSWQTMRKITDKISKYTERLGVDSAKAYAGLK